MTGCIAFHRTVFGPLYAFRGNHGQCALGAGLSALPRPEQIGLSCDRHVSGSLPVALTAGGAVALSRRPLSGIAA